MKRSKIIKQRFLKLLNLVAIASTFLIGLAGSVAAQSSDVNKPMTTDSVQGQWSRDKLVSHAYSFTGGPGVIRILFNFTSEEGEQLVGGQLMDADGRLFIPLENRSGAQKGLNFAAGLALPQGSRFVASYEINRRQKLYMRVYTWGPVQNAGVYEVRVTGDGVSFNQEVMKPIEPTSSNNPGSNKSSNNKPTGGDNTKPKAQTERFGLPAGAGSWVIERTDFWHDFVGGRHGQTFYRLNSNGLVQWQKVATLGISLLGDMGDSGFCQAQFSAEQLSLARTAVATANPGAWKVIYGPMQSALGDFLKLVYTVRNAKGQVITYQTTIYNADTPPLDLRRVTSAAYKAGLQARVQCRAK
jgi:hypothetical protein